MITVTTSHKADWYFDFVSPFSYLGLARLTELSGVEIRLRPVLFAGLLNHWGQKGPAEIPAKRAWTYRWCVWCAKQQGITFRFPAAHPFNPLPYLRLAIAANSSAEAIQQIFQALWTTGADPADEQFFGALLQTLHVDRARISAPDVKDTLRIETEQAVARGVFGVPTLLINGQLFWGADATDFAKRYLADPTIVATDEMRRVTALPVGVVRKTGA